MYLMLHMIFPVEFSFWLNVTHTHTHTHTHTPIYVCMQVNSVSVFDVCYRCLTLLTPSLKMILSSYAKCVVNTCMSSYSQSNRIMSWEFICVYVYVCVCVSIIFCEWTIVLNSFVYIYVSTIFLKWTILQFG